MPLRDIFVTFLFSAAALAALRAPFIGAVLWVWIGLMNPHRLGWGFAYSLPFAMAAGAVTLLGLLATRQYKIKIGAPGALLLMLTAWMCLTTATAILRDPSLAKLVDVLKVIVMTFMVAAVMQTRRHVVQMVWVIALSIAFFGTKGGIFTLLTGGAHRVWGPPSSLVNGNNELAVALVMTIPLLHYLRQCGYDDLPDIVKRYVSPGWMKRLVGLSMLLCAVSAIGTQSRGAFLAIGAMLAVLWWRSHGKLRLLMYFVVLIPVVLAFMPETWWARMDTIGSYQEDRSAMGRINAWTMAINIANDRFLGAGFATSSSLIYNAYAPNPSYVLVAHSIYFQVLGEHGWVGLALYLAMWLSAYRMAGWLHRQGKGRPELQWAALLGSMAKVSLVGFAVGGAFLSLAYWDMPLYLMMTLVVARHVLLHGDATVPARSGWAAQGARGTALP